MSNQKSAALLYKKWRKKIELHSEKTESPLESIAIIGGGSAGWMAAAALSHALDKSCKITLVESEDIGTVGVGEATIPPIRLFNHRLGIDEATFLKKTNGSIKLGIEFVDWSRKNHRYFHPFGRYGAEFDLVPFYHYWLAEFLEGRTSKIDDFSIAWEAAKKAKFDLPSRDKRQIQSRMDYAYHFDAGLYAKFLREFAQQRGVNRIEGKVIQVDRDGESGFITAVRLESNEVVSADLFLDCTGFRALLIGQTLDVEYQDWSHWLPCNCAVAAPSASTYPFIPYTRSTAKNAGWQWRIPLQHRVGNGHVYCDQYCTQDEAVKTFLDGMDGEPLADLNHLRFLTGKREEIWSKNCVAIGLSAGFMEPLESTSLHLIQYGILRLLALLPYKDMSALSRKEYNRLTDEEYMRVRDFLILHYKATSREDTEFWRYCKNMSIPDSLQYKIDHFQAHGQVVAHEGELFTNPSWIAVFLGQDITPQRAAAITQLRKGVPTAQRLKEIRQAIVEAADAMSLHEDFLNRYAKSQM